MPKVVGIGGIFVRAKDRKALAEWYRDHLGLEMDMEWFGSCLPRSLPDDPPDSYAVWSAFPEDTDYFGDRGNAFMVNFVVDDIEGLLEQLKAGGQETSEKVTVNDYGKFAWVTDPEGTRIELWSRPDGPLPK